LLRKEHYRTMAIDSLFLFLITFCNTLAALPPVIASTNIVVNTAAYDNIDSSAIRCEEFWVIRSASASLDEIAARFQVDTNELLLLNPNLSRTALVHMGTAVCGAGAAVIQNQPDTADSEGSIAVTLGKRHKNLSTYHMTPSMNINCTSIIMSAKPNLNFLTFLELNPMLDCADLSTKETTIYLPPGTTIQKRTQKSMRSTHKVNNDCIVGPWSNWTDCQMTTNEKTRYRHIYQEAKGDGASCPNTYESEICSTLSKRNLLEKKYCPDGYNGCSVPAGVANYKLFTPACNLHDICYMCDSHWGTSKSYCDSMFYSKMKLLCKNYWPANSFDLAWCLNTAGTYYTAVKLFGSSTDENKNSNLVDDGCHWKSDRAKVNNYLGAGFAPDKAGCSCLGNSCKYV